MSRTLFVAACVSLLACAACSSPAEPSDPGLAGSEAQRASFAFASLSSSAEILRTQTPVVGEPGAVTCPYGGSQRTTLVPSGASTARAALILKGCVLADSAGQRWTFTTLPQLDVGGTYVYADSISTNVSTLTGSMRVESANVRGTCRIDYRQVTVSNYVTRTVRVTQSGTYCGQSVDTTWSATTHTNRDLVRLDVCDARSSRYANDKTPGLSPGVLRIVRSGQGGN
jgi:hypothetical protein